MGIIFKSGIRYAGGGGGGGGQTYTAGPGIRIINNRIELDPATALEALGYEEMEIAMTDDNNQTTTITVIGKGE